MSQSLMAMLARKRGREGFSFDTVSSKDRRLHAEAYVSRSASDASSEAYGQ